VEIQFPFGALEALRRFRPDVVVSGELGARTALSALYARLAGVPLVIWSYQSRAWAATASRARRAWRRALLARADAVVGMGIQAREVLRALGVPDTRLFDAPNAHDHESLTVALAGRDATALRAALRAGLGCRERVALVAGRLVPAKGVRPLLAAWRELDPALRDTWTLLFVGDGPLRAEIEAAAAAGAPGEILCSGAVAASDMVDFYVGADLLVFPSLGDPWGLVVSEALACCVPVLCSQLAGCADDLIRPGENGWRFDPLDAAGFRRALGSALTCPDRDRMGHRARDIAKRFTPECMANGIRRAIAHAAGLSA
jgi:glycosyltransferase involved in cell wall biosynthesis